MRRGSVRAGLLIALLDGPAHGYQLIQSLADRSEGRWRPSPGAVYPTLEALLDEGFVTAEDVDGRRVFTLTDEGRREAENRRDEGVPWEGDSDDLDGRGLLHQASRELMGAAKQVGNTGTAEQVERAVELLTRARKDLYRLLAED